MHPDVLSGRQIVVIQNVAKCLCPRPSVGPTLTTGAVEQTHVLAQAHHAARLPGDKLRMRVSWQARDYMQWFAVCTIARLELTMNQPFRAQIFQMFNCYYQINGNVGNVAFRVDKHVLGANSCNSRLVYRYQIHRWVANEAGNKQVGWVVV